MSTAPVRAESGSKNVRHPNQVIPECPGEIKVEYNEASVIVKPALNPRELQAAFRFLYEIYVEKEGLVSPYKLPPKCVASRSKWDKWDRRPSTRHIVALFGGEVVGCVRLLYRKDGRLPIEEDGFKLPSDGGGECEVSKLVLHPDFRNGDILAAFYWYIFYICRTEQRLTSVIFGCQPKLETLYSRIGAEPVGTFMNTQLGTPCTVMRIAFVDEYDEQFKGGLLGRRHGKYPPAFLPAPEILTLVASQPNSPDGIASAWSAHRLDGKETDSTAGVWRLIVGEQKAIAKVVRNTAKMPRNADAERETAAYRYLESHPLGSGLCHPRLLTMHTKQDAATLLLEDMWTPQSRWLGYSDIVELAELVGSWQGTHCAVDCTNRESSFSPDYLRQAEEGIQALPGLAERASVLSPIVSGDDWVSATHIWNYRGEVLKSLADTPQAMAHQDLEARNCIVQQEGHVGKQFALIGWAASSKGPVGCDLGPLVFGSSLSFNWSVDDAVKIWNVALAYYIEALRNKSISCEPAMVRRSAVMTTVLRYIAWASHCAQLVLAASGQPSATRATHREMGQVVERYCEVRAAVLRLGRTEDEKSFSYVH